MIVHYILFKLDILNYLLMYLKLIDMKLLLLISNKVHTLEIMDLSQECREEHQQDRKNIHRFYN